LASDEYQISFHEFIYEDSQFFIECPSEYREKEFSFFECIKSGLMQQSHTALNQLTEGNTIEFLKNRSRQAHGYITEKIKKENSNNKFQFMKFAYHPIFDEEDNFNDSYFVSLPLFFRRNFLGWLLIFLDGTVVQNCQHLQETGRRLDWDVRMHCGRQVNRYVNKYFPAAHEFDQDDIVKGKDEFWKKCDRYLFTNLLKIAITARCPYYRFENNMHCFFPKMKREETASPRQWETMLNGKRVQVAFQPEIKPNVSSERSRIIRDSQKSAEEYCKNMKLFAETIPKKIRSSRRHER